MDDAAPRLIGLLLAGGIALMALRSQVGDTPRGERLFRVILLVFLLVMLGAAWMLLREQGRALAPAGPEDTTIAALAVPT